MHTLTVFNFPFTWLYSFYYFLFNPFLGSWHNVVVWYLFHCLWCLRIADIQTASTSLISLTDLHESQSPVHRGRGVWGRRWQQQRPLSVHKQPHSRLPHTHLSSPHPATAVCHVSRPIFWNVSSIQGQDLQVCCVQVSGGVLVASQGLFLFRACVLDLRGAKQMPWLVGQNLF